MCAIHDYCRMNVGLLVKELQTIQDTWPTLGHYLGIDLPKTKGIQQEYKHKEGTEGCKRQMFEFWLAKCPPEESSWKLVIQALEKLDEVELATKLKFKYVKILGEGLFFGCVVGMCMYYSLAGPDDFRLLLRKSVWSQL